MSAIEVFSIHTNISLICVFLKMFLVLLFTRLDLSFNEITKIEGLSTLVELEDLSLYVSMKVLLFVEILCRISLSPFLRMGCVF